MPHARGPVTGAEDLLALVRDADRDASPGALPVVALAVDEDPALRAAALARALRVCELERRGVWHGEWAELPPDLAPPPPRDLRAAWRERFAAARPIVLPGFVDPGPFEEELAARMRLFDELQEPGGLRRFLAHPAAPLGPEYEVTSVGPAPQGDGAADPARDLERAELAYARPASPQRFRDLWLKSGWLSTHDDDASLRLRLSFGREVVDDASRDLARHLAVAGLAERLLPECELAHGSDALAVLLDEWVGAECFLAQHIAYWNAPGGGALFHHDAFDEPTPGGQRGVVYVQLTGASAWLALSVADLAERVREFAGALLAGDAPWVLRALCPTPEAEATLRRLTEQPAALAGELARPGCGALAALVNRGPEFTGWLADAGHAWLLDPGDVIVLPNHGLGATCMHSVFCASQGPGYALSMAVRERHPRGPEDAAGGRRGAAARRRPGAAPGTRRRTGVRRRR